MGCIGNGQNGDDMDRKLEVGQHIRKADQGDTSRIMGLVNLAYRGNDGWTTEKALVDGDRLTRDELVSCMESEASEVLVFERDSALLGCVHIARLKPAEDTTEVGYIGLLAVHPSMQGQGLGKNLLEYAELYLKTFFQVSIVQMSVVSQRHELLEYYCRRGYEVFEQDLPYPKHLPLGEPRLKLTVSVLRKTL